MVFIPESRKELDYHFILWDFDQSKVNEKELERLEAKQIPPREDTDTDEDSDEKTDGKVDKVQASSCCTLF